MAVEKAVREALETVRPEGGGVDPGSELGLDSVQAMELIMEIEERLDISIPVDAFANARTFDQLCSGIAGLA